MSNPNLKLLPSIMFQIKRLWARSEFPVQSFFVGRYPKCQCNFKGVSKMSMQVTQARQGGQKFQKFGQRSLSRYVPLANNRTSDFRFWCADRTTRVGCRQKGL